MPKKNQMKRPKARDEMTDEEFNEIMSRGLAQAKACEGEAVDVFFERLISEIEDAAEEESNEVIEDIEQLTEEDLRIVRIDRFPR